MPDLHRPETLTVRGVTLRILTRHGDHTVIDYTAPAGFAGPRPHVHARSAEWFRVVSGTLVLALPEGEVTLEAGGAVEIPPGTVHAWRNGADAPLNFLFGFDRRGLDGYFRRLVELADGSAVWPPADPALLRDLGEEFDMLDPSAEAA